MVQPFIQQNQIPNEPELKDLLTLFQKQILLGLNCHHIGTIQDFDSTTQLASVQLVYKKTIFQPNAASGGYDPVLIDYPVLIDCPVIFLGGGSSSLTFPIESGDECILLFNDRDIDNWFAGISNAPVATPRLHSFTDAIALVGLRSLTNVLVDFDTARAVLQLNDSRVAVATDRVALEQGDDAAFDLQSDTATLALGTTQQKLTAAGKFSVTNDTGEFVAALITFLQTANAGGYPIVGDLSTLQSFQA